MENSEGICVIESCRKKATPSCCFRMCFNCCSVQSNANECLFHTAKKLRQLEIERYIDEGIEVIQNKKKNRKFVHFEEKFNDFNQTVLIWCFNDFIRFNKFNQETFQQLERMQDRRNRLKLKRFSSNTFLAQQKTPDVNKKPTKMHIRQIKYEKMKESWTDKCPQDKLPSWLNKV